MKIKMVAMLAALACLAAIVLTPTAHDRAEAAVSRMAGADRYATSVQVSLGMNLTRGGVLYLASGEGYADALAAAPVAAAENAPLLLSTQSAIPGVVVNEIQRLAPRQIVIVGGVNALGGAVESRARQLAGDVVRIAGDNRVDTSMQLLDRLQTLRPVSQVWVVSATSFPDALVAGATAARFGHGLVLTSGDDASFRSMVDARRAMFRNVYIAGGVGGVSASAANFLAQVSGGHVSRYYGENRYETATAINAAFATRGGTYTMILASGENFPDGLVAGVLAAQRGAPLFLTTRACQASGSMTDEYRRLRISTTLVVGGLASVSADAANLRLCAHSEQAAYNEMIRQVNALRASHGLRPLQLDLRLQQLAQGWSQQQTTMSIAHNPTFSQTIFSYGYFRTGENVAWRTRWDPAHPMELWIASPGHYANLMNPHFTHIGVGAAMDANGQWYWTQNFGGTR